MTSIAVSAFLLYKKETKPIVLIDLISHFENYFE